MLLLIVDDDGQISNITLIMVLILRHVDSVLRVCLLLLKQLGGAVVTCYMELATLSCQFKRAIAA